MFAKKIITRFKYGYYTSDLFNVHDVESNTVFYNQNILE